MGIPDPSLGFSSAFDSSLFNNAIRFAMQMGAPLQEELRPTFVFASAGVSYWRGEDEVLNPRVDRDGSPLDPEIEERQVPPRRIQVDCAVEVERGALAGETPVGNFQQTRLVVTLLEEQYAQVKGCASCEYNGDNYLYAFEPDNFGLFDAGVHTLIFNAEDET